MKAGNKTIYSFPAIIEQDENGMLVGRIPALRSCYTQAKTLPVLYKRLEEAAKLCLEVEKKLFHSLPEQNEFLGVHKLQLAVR